MIHSNFPTHDVGRMYNHNPALNSAPPQQAFSGQFNFGGLSLSPQLGQLINQLLQQLSSLQNNQGNIRNSHCSNGHQTDNSPGRGRGDAHGAGGRQRVQSAQVFNTPQGANTPGPALNGDVYEFTVDASRRGRNLSFATMLAATNDQFIAPDSRGIPLYDRQGNPLEGDITHLLAVWDAGTEANEPVGSGANQPANQAGPDTGPADPQNYVRRSEEGVGPVDQLVKASVQHNGNGSFTVRIENISGQNGGNEIPLAPGVAATHSKNSSPLFNDMRMDRGQGLEALAEDGDPMQLLQSLQARQTRY
ncbi:MAG: spondin domain-containing protein [Thiolinea sp.]